MYVIYCLVHPTQEYLVFYVGLTSNLKQRYIAHLNSGVDAINELLRNGLLPICRTLEIIEEKELAKAREKYWINYYRELRMPLLNLSISDPERKQRKKNHKALTRSHIKTLREKITHLYLDEHVPRGEMCKRLGIGTQIYWLVKQVCDELDAR